MKITDPQIIQTGEKKLIDDVQKHLDLETVKKILTDRMADTSFTSKGGQIVVHDNQIAFRLDFDLKLSGSLLFDRQGNYIPAPLEAQTFFNEETSEKDTAAPSVPAQKNKPAANDTPDEDELDLVLDEAELDGQDLSAEDDIVLEEKADEDDPGSDVILDDDMLDDDIEDILKESRDFWEEKKGT